MVLRHSRILICSPDITLYKVSQHRLFIRYRERRLFRVVLTLQTSLAQAAHVPFFSVSRRFLAVHGDALCLPSFIQAELLRRESGYWMFSLCNIR